MDVVIPEVFNLIEGISFNETARCKMAAFSEEALRYGAGELRRKGKAIDPYRLMFKICLDYSSRENLPTNWDLSRQLCFKYGITEEQQGAISIAEKKKEPAKSYSKPQEKADKPYRHLSDKEYYATTDQSVLRPMGFNLDEKKAAEGKLTKKEIAEYIRKLGTKHWIIYHHLYVKLLEDNKANGGLDHDFIESKETTEFIAMKEEIAHAFNITDDNGKIINKKDESVSLTLEKLQQNFNAVLKTKHPEASNVLFIADDLDHKNQMLVLSPLSGTSAIEHVDNPPTPLSDNTLQDFIDISVGDYYDDDIDSSIYI